MTQHRVAKPLALAALAILVLAQHQLARADNPSHPAPQAPKAASGASQSKTDPLAANSDFAGLTLSDEQKAQVAKIHEESNSHRELVAKDTKMGPEQKDAMISGYTRLEYGQIFRVLTPEQQRQVRQKIAARKAAEQAKQKKRPPQ